MLYADNSCRSSGILFCDHRSEVVSGDPLVPTKNNNVTLGVCSGLPLIGCAESLVTDLQWKLSEKFTEVSSALKIKR